MYDPRNDIYVEQRPWGQFTRYVENVHCTVKVIEVEAREQLSLQRHQNRDELWIPLDDGLTLKIAERTLAGTVGQAYLVSRRTVHRVLGPATGSSRFLEIAFGQFDEADIERLEDRYQR